MGSHRVTTAYSIHAMQSGLVLDEGRADEWVLGGVPRSSGRVTTFGVVNPSGSWLSVARSESQMRYGLETMSCATFGTLAAISALCRVSVGGIGVGGSGAALPPLLKRRVLTGWRDRCAIHAGSPKVGGLKSDVDWSERYVSTLAGTTRNGNSPHKVAETIRKYGLVPEELMPFSAEVDTWEEFYDMEMARGLKARGRKWGYEFQHAWLGDGSVSAALKVSPVGVAVWAWAYDASRNRYVTPEGVDTVNHWCLVVGETEDSWVILDSYEPFIKYLDKDFRFKMAKIYRITTPIHSLRLVDSVRKIWDCITMD